jgi:hypothetical protein
MFDTASLSAAVAKQLAEANVPDDHRNAIVLSATTSGTVKLVFTTKVNNVWQIDAVFSADGQKHVEGGIQVKATW